MSPDQKKADDKFNKDLRKKWKDMTNCREGFVMDQCKNAPKPKTTTAAAARRAAGPAGQQQQPRRSRSSAVDRRSARGARGRNRLRAR